MVSLVIPFDAQDPFPLVSISAENYVASQRHAAEVDEWLGLQVHATEQALNARADREKLGPAERRKFWIGLPAQTLLTPYAEIRGLLSLLQPQPSQTVVDLGAGYGRMGFVLARHYPGVSFFGYEAVPERAAAGEQALRRFPGTHSRMQIIEADIAQSGFQIPAADFYFLYDYSDHASVERTLEQLRSMAGTRAITVIGRGRLARDLIERQHPWLSQVIKPTHTAHFSIYHSQ